MISSRSPRITQWHQHRVAQTTSLRETIVSDIIGDRSGPKRVANSCSLKTTCLPVTSEVTRHSATQRLYDSETQRKQALIGCRSPPHVIVKGSKSSHSFPPSFIGLLSQMSGLLFSLPQRQGLWEYPNHSSGELQQFINIQHQWTNVLKISLPSLAHSPESLVDRYQNRWELHQRPDKRGGAHCHSMETLQIDIKTLC